MTRLCVMPLSNTAIRVLLRLRETARNPDIRRARERQVSAGLRGIGVRELGLIYREEMAYTPADKLADIRSLGR